MEIKTKDPKDFNKQDYEQIKQQVEAQKKWLDEKLRSLQMEIMNLYPFTTMLDGQLAQLKAKIESFDKNKKEEPKKEEPKKS